MQKKLIKLFEFALGGIRIYKIAIVITAIIDTLRMYPYLKLRYYILFYLVVQLAEIAINNYLLAEDKEIQEEAEKQYINYTFQGTFADWCNLPRNMRNKMHNCEFIVHDEDGKMRFFKQLPDITYTVQRGDTLNKIAKKTNTSLQELFELNNFAKLKVISPGQTIIIKEGEWLEL